MSESITAKVCVSTYGKYNTGNLQSVWIDLDDHTDLESFWAACREFHKNENDPEFMFVDIDCDVAGAISEADIDERIFDILLMDDYEQQIIAAYSQLHPYDLGGVVKNAVDRYRGVADSVGDFVEQQVEQQGFDFDVLNGLVIDWEASWHSNWRHDHDEVRYNTELHFFSNN